MLKNIYNTVMEDQGPIGLLIAIITFFWIWKPMYLPFTFVLVFGAVHFGLWLFVGYAFAMQRKRVADEEARRMEEEQEEDVEG